MPSSIKYAEKYGLERGKNGLKVYLMCEIPSNVILADEFVNMLMDFSLVMIDATHIGFR